MLLSKALLSHLAPPVPPELKHCSNRWSVAFVGSTPASGARDASGLPGGAGSAVIGFRVVSEVAQAAGLKMSLKVSPHI